MNERRILLGISGGIAAYKMATLTRLLVKAGASVRVIMTEEAKSFVSPLTMATLSRNPVMSRLYHPEDGSWYNHVELGLWADLMLVAPATANTLAKMAHGQSDSLLLTTYLSARCPVWVAPAMDLDMWQHRATQRNIQVLESDGVRVIPPAEGPLASGLTGPGRLPEPEFLEQQIRDWFSQQPPVSDRAKTVSGDHPLSESKGLSLLPTPFQEKHILITSGPTQEAIDPVRFIGNHSSGKMGVALADVFAAAGARVTLVRGPGSAHSSHPAVREIAVSSAESMYEACREAFPKTDVFIAAAAVADYRPESPSTQKIKKKEDAGDALVLRLVKTRDVLAEMGQLKQPGQILIGFALETENEVENALKKLERKHLDLIVLNSLNDPGAGFGVDTNRITLVENRNRIDKFPLCSKREAAQLIADRLAELLSR